MRRLSSPKNENETKESEEMDEVQEFISRNKHQLGYIMGEASRQWIKENPTGALTVGPCNIFIEKYGDYHTLQDKVDVYEKALKRIVFDETVTFEQTEIIAKRALKLPPFDSSR